MRIFSIVASFSLFLLPLIEVSSSSAQPAKKDKCYKIGRTLSDNSRYICWRQIYEGDGERFLCFSSGEIIDLEHGKRPRACYPVILQSEHCKENSNCRTKATRGDEELQILSDSTFIERNPTIEWTPLPGASYKVMLRKLDGSIIWNRDLRTTSVKYPGQLEPGLYRLTIFAFDSNGDFLDDSIDAVHILSPEKIDRLQGIVSTINSLQISSVDRAMDLAAIYAAVGLDSKAMSHYLSQ